jgi:hypothetical protein
MTQFDIIKESGKTDPRRTVMSTAIRRFLLRSGNARMELDDVISLLEFELPVLTPEPGATNITLQVKGENRLLSLWYERSERGEEWVIKQLSTGQAFSTQYKNGEPVRFTQGLVTEKLLTQAMRQQLLELGDKIRAAAEAALNISSH